MKAKKDYTREEVAKILETHAWQMREIAVHIEDKSARNGWIAATEWLEKAAKHYAQ